MATAALQIRQAYVAGIRPDTQLTVSEWADAHRRLPKKSSSEPGPWRTARTPYLREIMDNFSMTSEIEETVLMKAAQVAGTEAILNCVGYVIDHNPGPMILVRPTLDEARRFVRQRLDPLMTDTPSLAVKVADARARDSGNTMFSKEFPAGQLIVTGANSAVGLRSMPARDAFLDEIDGYPGDVDEEGSPLDLVDARQRTFARRKTFKVSTPTIEGRSAIEAAYQSTDQRRYYVPCPFCGEMQPLEFARLVWTKLLLPPKQAVYECRACGEMIQNHQKTQMLAAGEWRAEAPGVGGDRKRGYHLNALYAPVGWMSWGEIALKFVQSYRNPEKYRVFINTVLGEVWNASGGEAPAWEPLKNRRETYAIGSVPAGVLWITAGVDVQKDRVVYEVVGWGRGKRSWSIDYGEIPGDTADLDNGPWGQVDALLARSYAHAGGVEMPIRMLAVDSGYNTQTVYNWARRYPMNRVIAVKGRDDGGALIGTPQPVEVTDRGRRMKRGYRVWPVTGSIAKSELYGFLHLEILPEKGEPAGYCHFPEYGDEYFRQLTAEQLVPHKTRKGFVRLTWELIPGRQNRVYARAAAALAGLDRSNESDWKAREKMLGIVVSAAALNVALPAPVAVGAPARAEQVGPAPTNTKRRWLAPRGGAWLKGNRPH